MTSENIHIPDVDTLLIEFAEYHNIIFTPLVERESSAIQWTIRTKLEIDKNLRDCIDDLNQFDLLWPLLRSMLDRTFEYVQGAIVAYVTGSPAASEVISRTAIESAINSMLIIRDDRNGSRFTEYLAHYFIKEKEEINKWLKAVKNIPDDDKLIHQTEAIQKEDTLIVLEKIINKALLEMGLPTTEKITNKRINIKDKFDKLGLEIDYYTVYAALCSQTHSDAEDLLNYFVFTAFGDQELINKVAIETVNFSRLMMYFAVKYYIMASGYYAIRFDLKNALEIITEGRDNISNIMQKIANNITSLS
ncbi:MAG: hypothetical protein JHC73_13580 [Dolichospermum sp.]|jgi:hypothetical protein|nr:hypothetical protein [Dolichospermum sp.]